MPILIEKHRIFASAIVPNNELSVKLWLQLIFFNLIWLVFFLILRLLLLLVVFYVLGIYYFGVVRLMMVIIVFLLKFVINMEITIYASLDAKNNRKCLARMRVSNPDCFCFEKSIDVFKSIYGANVVIEFLCL